MIKLNKFIIYLQYSKLLKYPAQPCTVKRIEGTVWRISSAVSLGRACHTLHFGPAAWYVKLAQSGSTTTITK